MMPKVSFLSFFLGFIFFFCSGVFAQSKTVDETCEACCKGTSNAQKKKVCQGCCNKGNFECRYQDCGPCGPAVFYHFEDLAPALKEEEKGKPLLEIVEYRDDIDVCKESPGSDKNRGGWMIEYCRDSNDNDECDFKEIKDRRFRHDRTGHDGVARKTFVLCDKEGEEHPKLVIQEAPCPLGYEGKVLIFCFDLNDDGVCSEKVDDNYYRIEICIKDKDPDPCCDSTPFNFSSLYEDPVGERIDTIPAGASVGGEIFSVSRPGSNVAAGGRAMSVLHSGAVGGAAGATFRPARLWELRKKKKKIEDDDVNEDAKKILVENCESSGGKNCLQERRMSQLKRASGYKIDEEKVEEEKDEREEKEKKGEKVEEEALAHYYYQGDDVHSFFGDVSNSLSLSFAGSQVASDLTNTGGLDPLRFLSAGLMVDLFDADDFDSAGREGKAISACIKDKLSDEKEKKRGLLEIVRLCKEKNRAVWLGAIGGTFDYDSIDSEETGITESWLIIKPFATFEYRPFKRAYIDVYLESSFAAGISTQTSNNIYAALDVESVLPSPIGLNSTIDLGYRIGFDCGGHFSLGGEGIHYFSIDSSNNFASRFSAGAEVALENGLLISGGVQVRYHHTEIPLQAVYDEGWDLVPMIGIAWAQSDEPVRVPYEEIVQEVRLMELAKKCFEPVVSEGLGDSKVIEKANACLVLGDYQEKGLMSLDPVKDTAKEIYEKGCEWIKGTENEDKHLVCEKAKMKE